MDVSEILQEHHQDDQRIIRDWLEAHEYTGLLDDDGECGCEIDDLFP